MKNRNKNGLGRFIRRLHILTAFLLIAASAVFPPPARGAQLSKAGIAELFHEANDLYNQADQAAATNPEKARSLYQQAAMRCSLRARSNASPHRLVTRTSSPSAMPRSCASNGCSSAQGSATWPESRGDFPVRVMVCH